MAPGPKRFVNGTYSSTSVGKVLLRGRGFHVDDGRLPSDRDRFLQAADFELGVDRDRLTELEPTPPGSPCLKLDSSNLTRVSAGGESTGTDRYRSRPSR